MSKYVFFCIALVLFFGFFTQKETAMDTGKDSFEVLTIVSSTTSGVNENEFLVFESHLGTISWKFFNPNGELHASGHSRIPKLDLAKIFNSSKDASAGMIDDKGIANFSILFCSSKHDDGVIPLVDEEQRLNLLNDPLFKTLLVDVRKRVFGKRFSVPSFLALGTKPGGGSRTTFPKGKDKNVPPFGTPKWDGQKGFQEKIDK